jgi:preprotein translocase subunit SecY
MTIRKRIFYAILILFIFITGFYLTIKIVSPNTHIEIWKLNKVLDDNLTGGSFIES